MDYGRNWSFGGLGFEVFWVLGIGAQRACACETLGGMRHPPAKVSTKVSESPLNPKPSKVGGPKKGPFQTGISCLTSRALELLGS